MDLYDNNWRTRNLPTTVGLFKCQHLAPLHFKNDLQGLFRNIYLADINRERKVATSRKSIADGLREKLQLDLLKVCGELSFNRERDLGLCSSFKREIPLWKKVLTPEQLVSRAKVFEIWCFMCKKSEEKG